jgi:hypothetical protein
VPFLLLFCPWEFFTSTSSSSSRTRTKLSLSARETHARSLFLSRPRARLLSWAAGARIEEKKERVCVLSYEELFFLFSLFFPRESKIPFFHKKRLFFASLEFSSLLLLLLLRFETFYMYRREHTRTDASDDDYKHR